MGFNNISSFLIILIFSLLLSYIVLVIPRVNLLYIHKLLEAILANIMFKTIDYSSPMFLRMWQGTPARKKVFCSAYFHCCKTLNERASNITDEVSIEYVFFIFVYSEELYITRLVFQNIL